MLLRSSGMSSFLMKTSQRTIGVAKKRNIVGTGAKINAVGTETADKINHSYYKIHHFWYKIHQF